MIKRLNIEKTKYKEIIWWKKLIIRKLYNEWSIESETI